MTEPSPAPDVSTVDAMRPTRGAERIEIIDILRGFAVFGILTVNMAFFNSPQQLRGVGIEWWPDTLDRVVGSAIIFLSEGKFYTIFSMLFGLGLFIQFAGFDQCPLSFDRDLIRLQSIQEDINSAMFRGSD